MTDTRKIADKSLADRNSKSKRATTLLEKNLKSGAQLHISERNTDVNSKSDRTATLLKLPKQKIQNQVHNLNITGIKSAKFPKTSRDIW